MLRAVTSCPRLDTISVKTNVAFLDEILVRSSADASPRDTMFIRAYVSKLYVNSKQEVLVYYNAVSFIFKKDILLSVSEKRPNF